MTFPDSITAFDRVYVPKSERFMFVWDDQNPDYGYKCRTQSPDFTGPDNPPAVIRFYKDMREGSDYRVNLTKDPTWEWEETVIMLNDGDEGKFGYWTGPSRAQFNTTGWAQLGYIGMSGNEIRVLERVGEWVRFETLRPTDWMRARSMSAKTHPTLIHHFTCVSWRQETRTTVRIDSTGTQRGQVYYPLITWEGSAWIPARHVVKI